MKFRQLKPAQRYRKSKSKGHRLNLWKKAHGKCWYCGAQIGKKDFILEHQEPFSRGGADSSRNLVIACKACDRKKGANNVSEFRRKTGVEKFYGEQSKDERRVIKL